MCLLNYNRKEKKYKHLTYAERTIFLQYTVKKSKFN